MADDLLGGIFGPQTDPLHQVFGGSAPNPDFLKNPLSGPAQPTPLLDAVSGGPAKEQPDPLADIFAAPTVHPSKNDAAKVQALTDQQDAQTYHDESWDQWVSDKVAEASAGLPASVASTLKGFGDFLQRSQEAIKKSGLGDDLPKDLSLSSSPIGMIGALAASPALPKALNTVGGAVGDYAQTIESAVPDERKKQFGNQFAAVTGSMAGLLASAMVAPEAVGPQLLGQGFDQINEALKAKGESGHSTAGLTAEAAGGVAVAALNATGLGILLNGVSLPIKGTVIRGLTSVALRSGADATTFAAQGIVTNLAAKLGVDPSTPVSQWGDVLQGSLQNAEMGGLAGAIFGAVTGAHHPTADIAVGEPNIDVGKSALDALSPDIAHQQAAMQAGASEVTPDDHTSPLPTDLIQQGKGAMKIDLDHPESTVLSTGKTVQQTVDEALGPQPTQVESVSAPIEIAPQVDLTRSESAHLPDPILKGLLARGIPEHVAEGVAAGTVAEARGDPNALNPTSGAFGLGQWLGPRKAELIKRYGDHPTIDQQLDFLTYELNGGDPGGKAVLAAGSSAEALDAYIRKFMRPAAGKETTGDLERGEAALGGAGENLASAGENPNSPDGEFQPKGVAFDKLDTSEPLPSARTDSPDEWQAFHPDTGTLGISRADLPQIESAHHGALVNFINARDVSHQEETVDPKSLSPTQAEFNPAKVETALGITDGNRAVLVSSDNHILDGTHQWLASLQTGEPLRVIRLDAPIHDIIDLAHEFPSSTVSTESEAARTAAQPVPELSPQDRAEALAVRLVQEGKRDTSGITRDGDSYSFGQRLGLMDGPMSTPGKIHVELADKPGQPHTFDEAAIRAQAEGAPQPDLSPQEQLKAKIAANAEPAQPVTEAGPEAQGRIKQPAPAPRPRDFFGAVAEHLGERSKSAGVRVRVSAEDAINHGVPADEIYINPKAKYPTVKLRMAKVFATTKAPLESKASPVHIVSLDDLGDRFEAERFGAESGDGIQEHRLAPETAGDLLARSLARDDSTLDRHDKRYERYQAEKQQTAHDVQTDAERENIRELADHHGLEVDDQTVEDALNHRADGHTRESALEQAIREQALRSLDELAEHSGKPEYLDHAGELYEGHEAEQRGEVAPQGVARSEGSQGGEAESGHGGEKPVEAAGSERQAHAPEQAQHPEQAEVENPLAPQATDTRDHLQRKADEPLKPEKEQKPVGSDGGLFDSTHEQTGDLFASPSKPAESPSDPMVRAKAALKDALTALEGQTQAKPIDFEDYASQRGASRQGYGDAGFHSPAGNVGRATRQQQLRIQAERDAALAQRRGDLQREYDAAVARGEIRPLTSSERLELTAAGPEEKESTQAARRVLAKRAARKSASEQSPEERGMEPLFDSEEPTRQIGYHNPKTGETELDSQPRAQAGDITKQPVFYSALERGVENSSTKRAPAEQWIATLKRTPGIKQEELEWSGVEDWLKMQKGPVDKEALLQLVRDGGIKVDEVVLGRPDEEKLADYGLTPDDLENGNEDVPLIVEDDKTQFDSWSSDPSNPTYRELLITLPSGEGGNPERAPSTHWDHEAVVAHARFMDKRDAEGKRVLFVEEVQSDWHQKGRDQGYEAKGADLEATRKAYEEAKRGTYNAKEALIAYGEKHDMMDRPFFGTTISKLGFDEQAHALSVYLTEKGGDHEYEKLVDDLKTAELRRDEATMARHNAEKGIPEAPFKSTWPALVMKRMIRWAVDHGYDKIAWTTGDEQAERYNLSQAIGSVRVWPADDGRARLYFGRDVAETLAANGAGEVDRSSNQLLVTEQQAETIFGKDLAKRIFTEGFSEPESGKLFSGLDLRVGGEGMRAFYDRNLVNITNDIVKKYGAKVEKVDVTDAKGGYNPGPIADVERARSRGLVKENPGFTLTDKLKEAAASGLPLFNRGRGRLELTDEQVSALRDGLQKQLEQFGISDRIALNASKSMELGRPEFRAQYWNRVISIALDRSDNPFETNAHEAWHAVGPEGIHLVTKTEYNLVNEAGWADPDIRRHVLLYYPEETDAARKEEAGAFWIQKQWTLRNKTFASKIVDRIGGFMRAMKAAAMKVFGKDGMTPEQVADQLFGGKLGERPEGYGGTISRRGKPINVTFGKKPLGQVDDERPVTIDESHPDRLFAPVRAVMESVSEGSSERVGKSLDNLRSVLQDRMLPVLSTQAAIEEMLGRKIGDDENPYLAEELFHGRVGARLDQLSSDHIDPLFAQMRDAKVKPEELEEYLYARHAPERNARISEINPAFAKGTGSGMTDEDAKAIMDAVEKQGKTPIFESLASKVDAMLGQALDTRVESGLLSKDEAALWRKTYKNYVPLRGLPGDEDVEGARINRQSGMSVKGKESRRAFGRKTPAQDILAHSILQAEEAIVRAEQNEVAKSLGELAKAAPDETFWKVDKIKQVPVFNKATGQVSYRSESRIAADDAPFTVSYKDGGAEHRVTFNRASDTAVRTATAMRNLNIQQYKFLVKYFGAVNRFLSKINTSWSPEFVISNAFRDLQTASINLAGVDVKGLERKVFADYPAALAAATKGAFGKDSGDWGKWYREFKFEGGQTSFNDMSNITTLRSRIEQAAKVSGRLGAKRLIKTFFETVDHVNDGVENALRLSTYKNARELGVSKKRAASLAKNVTVNFNRKGSAGPLLNTLYMFYNASMQGNARILLAMKSRKVQGILAGTVALGFGLQLLNQMRSDRDKDGELFYNKIPEFEQERNLILMLDGGKYVKIPMPWGYNVFPNFGRMLARLYQGEHPMRAMGDFASGAIDAFNPVGGAQSLLDIISPTITDPIVDLEQNRDYAGRPIMPDPKDPGQEVPDSQRYWQSVPPYDKAVTDWLNSHTGGDSVRPGSIDWSPEVLHFLQNQVLGSAGSFVGNAASVGSKLVSNDPLSVIDTNEIPFSRRVMGDKPAYYDKAAFYARLQQVEQDVNYAKDYAKQGNRDGLVNMVNSPEDSQVLALYKTAKEARSKMNATRKIEGQLENAVARGELTDAEAKQVKVKLQERENNVIDAFNSAYLSTVSKPLRP